MRSLTAAMFDYFHRILNQSEAVRSRACGYAVQEEMGSSFAVEV